MSETRELEGGLYTILSRLGHGAMGEVVEAKINTQHLGFREFLAERLAWQEAEGNKKELFADSVTRIDEQRDVISGYKERQRQVQVELNKRVIKRKSLVAQIEEQSVQKRKVTGARARQIKKGIDGLKNNISSLEMQIVSLSQKSNPVKQRVEEEYLALRDIIVGFRTEQSDYVSERVAEIVRQINANIKKTDYKAAMLSVIKKLKQMGVRFPKDWRFAIKTSRSGVDAEIAQRTQDEGKHIVTLANPGIVQAYSIKSDYTVYELVKNKVDANDIAEGKEKYSHKDIVSAIIEIADGLAFAHEEGLIHRDIKPDNIALRDVSGVLHGQSYDWGIAHSEEMGMTQSGVAIGTPHYAAPEQMMGNPIPKSDVFALAGTLYSILSGVEAFNHIQGDNLNDYIGKRLKAIAMNINDVMRSKKRKIDPVLAKIIMSGLENEIEYRPSMDEFAQALDDWMNKKPVLLPEKFKPRKTWAQKYLTKTNIGIAAAAVVLTAAGIGVGVNMAGGNGEDNTAEVIQQSQKEQEKAKAEKIAERKNNIGDFYEQFVSKLRDDKKYDSALHQSILTEIGLLPVEAQAEFVSYKDDLVCGRKIGDFIEFKGEYTSFVKSIDKFLEKGNFDTARLDEFEKQRAEFHAKKEDFVNDELNPVTLSGDVGLFREEAREVSDDLEKYKKTVSERKILIKEYNTALDGINETLSEISDYTSAQNLMAGKVNKIKLIDYESDLKKIKGVVTGFKDKGLSVSLDKILSSEKEITDARTALNQQAERAMVETKDAAGKYSALVASSDQIDEDIEKFFVSGTYSLEELSTLKERVKKAYLSFEAENFKKLKLSAKQRTLGIKVPVALEKELLEYSKSLTGFETVIKKNQKAITAMLGLEEQINTLIEKDPNNEKALKKLKSKVNPYLSYRHSIQKLAKADKRFQPLVEKVKGYKETLEGQIELAKNPFSDSSFGVMITRDSIVYNKKDSSWYLLDQAFKKNNGKINGNFAGNSRTGKPLVLPNYQTGVEKGYNLFLYDVSKEVGVDGALALGFNGGWIEIPHDKSLNLEDGYIISVEMSLFSNDKPWQAIINKGPFGQRTFQITIGDGNPNKKWVNFYEIDSGENKICQGELLKFNEWYHLRAEYDGKTQRTFTNGHLNNSINREHNKPCRNNSPIEIGRQITNSDYLFYGSIRSLAIKNIASK